MFEGKKLVCPVNHRNNFSNLFSFKKFPIYMGVVKKNFKPEFQDLNFSLNGGINSLEEVKSIFKTAPRNLLGVMMGRARVCWRSSISMAPFSRPRIPIGR